MARATLIRTNEFPYHITTRCNNKEWFDLNLDVVWKFALKALYYASQNIPAEIEAFVLMQNHYHLVIYTPEANIDEFMRYFNWKFSKLIRNRTFRINHIFGSRYKWSLIDDQTYYFNVIKYVFQNPLKAKISTRIENYKYSSIYYQYRGIKLPINFATNWSSNLYLEELNYKFSTNEIEEFKKSLSRNGKFAIEKLKITNPKMISFNTSHREVSFLAYS